MAIKSKQLKLPELLGELNELEKTILPRVAQISLNRAVFDGRERLRQEAKQRFIKVSREASWIFFIILLYTIFIKSTNIIL